MFSRAQTPTDVIMEEMCLPWEGLVGPTGFDDTVCCLWWSAAFNIM